MTFLSITTNPSSIVFSPSTYDTANPAGIMAFFPLKSVYSLFSKFILASNAVNLLNSSYTACVFSPASTALCKMPFSPVSIITLIPAKISKTKKLYFYFLLLKKHTYISPIEIYVCFLLFIP